MWISSPSLIQTWFLYSLIVFFWGLSCLTNIVTARSSFKFFFNSFLINCVTKVLALMKLCRYVSDGKPFWQYIVSSSTGCSDSQYFEELYNYYTTNKVRVFGSRFFLRQFYCLWWFLLFYLTHSYDLSSDNSLQAWHLCDPDAERVFKALRQAGVKIAIVSNFDTRLRPLLRALNCDHWFDAVAVSAEVSVICIHWICRISFICFCCLLIFFFFFFICISWASLIACFKSLCSPHCQ